jgi:hypothetical protein
MFEFIGIFIGTGIFLVVVALFIVRTGKRPDDCTCKSYNWFSQGPVNKCPTHKHYGQVPDIPVFPEPPPRKK